MIARRETGEPSVHYLVWSTSPDVLRATGELGEAQQVETIHALETFPDAGALQARLDELEFTAD